MADLTTAPRVSVVIPVKDRRALLALALDGLEAQTYRDFEVVVVDDGSSDGSAEEAAARVIAGRPVRVVRAGGIGAVGARDAGVRAAAGEVLAFTDSDCVPRPEWLAAAVAAIDEGADLVNGRTVPARPLLPLERSMGSGLEGLYPTCNVLYRRDAFERAGGFDRSLAREWGFRPDRRSRGDGFGEDTVLGWRIARTGTARYAPDAIVEHAVFAPDLRDVLSRTARVAAFPALVKACPELRTTLLVHKVQLGGRTRTPVYALVIALAARRWRLAALAAAWWAAVRYRELRRFPVTRARRAALLPQEMAIDVITATALVTGSARARAIVL